MQNKLSRNFLIGVSFLIALVLLYFGVNFLKGINVLKKKNTYVVLFDDVTGLYTSSPIFVNGFQVGLVNGMKIHSNHPIRFAVNINLEDEFRIPKGSSFEFGSDFLGASAVSLVTDQDSREYHVPGDTLSGKRQTDVMSSVGKMLPKAEALLSHLDSIAISINKLMESPMWANTMQGVEETVNGLNASAANLNKVLRTLDRDLPGITGNLTGITGDLKDVSGKLTDIDFVETFNSIDSTLSNINILSTKLISSDNSFGKLTNDTQLHDSLTHTLQSVSKLLEEIRLDPEKYLTVKVRLF